MPLYFSTVDDTLDVLATLPEVFALENAEANLFNPVGKLLEDAGPWARILNYLLSNGGELDAIRGRTCGVHWTHAAAKVEVKVGRKRTPRFARWLRIQFGNEILIAAFLPHIYKNEGGKKFADHRFVVGCSDESILPLVMLFTDNFTGYAEGDDSWEAGSADSANMA